MMRVSARAAQVAHQRAMVPIDTDERPRTVTSDEASADRQLRELSTPQSFDRNGAESLAVDQLLAAHGLERAPHGVLARHAGLADTMVTGGTPKNDEFSYALRATRDAR